ncbi:mRNA-degrading endonuclease toxin of MazEF toxin-antitoxin module [Allocatelliglobosispora scoriae]|uniref:mRNA-degrading endonuclease toxin of MazEF toxin-antitoxin module n=1 Tax=Allocatelliglobosispora scoriae TaxID=643052 RepID=A0A841BXK8_9ACTN|nr:hypothetical protein [Allocatelliglobosispora scoriae]MBB5871879.1 mRNA-degrading endonuclease toxin of MazEF toxin-antitoxin module [Allocatelliglobosispora scoriae]
MNHGEVWTVQRPGGRWRVAVVSADGYNDAPGALPFVVPIVRTPGGILPPYTAPLVDPDPVGGVALVAELGQVDPKWATERVGMLTGASTTAVGNALRELFLL